MQDTELPEKIEPTTPNFQTELAAKIAEIAPEALSDGKLDVAKLRELVNGDAETSQEKFGLFWPGKRAAQALAQIPTTATLVPAPEESEDWENTKNLFIEGDNLEVLKALQNSYRRKVKMIYIDPPYNTGKEFIYPDKFSEGLQGYLDYTGQKNELGENTESKQETGGRKHSNWLSMMYPRLQLAKSLLTQDGAIFVSIGDDEVDSLKRIMIEVFGEENFVGQICRITKRGGNKGDFIKPKKDYVLFFFRDKQSVVDYGKIKTSENSDWQKEVHNGEEREYRRGDIPYREKLEVRANQRYYIEAPDSSLIIPKGNVFPEEKDDAAQVRPESQADKCWTWSRDRYLAEKAKGRFIFVKSQKSPFLNEFGQQSAWTIYKKVFREEYETGVDVLSDLIEDCENSLGTKEVKALQIPFDYPKPTRLIKHLAKMVTRDGDIVMDFFAGSASSAHAVMELNAEEGTSRTYIQVQLPEPTGMQTEAYREGYKTIADISKERIRRAAKKNSPGLRR